MTAAELMHRDVVTVPADTPLLEVQRLLVASDLPGMPVIDDGTVVGLVTAIDVMRALDQALDDDVDEAEPEDPGERLESLSAADIASPDVVWVTAQTPIVEVARLVRSHSARLVLVGTPDHLEGTISEADLVAVIR